MNSARRPLSRHIGGGARAGAQAALGKIGIDSVDNLSIADAKPDSPEPEGQAPLIKRIQVSKEKADNGG